MICSVEEDGFFLPLKSFTAELCKGLHLQEVQRLRLQMFQSKFCNVLKY